MRTCTILTVSESKRLIAKGIVKFDVVRRALEEGTVAVAKGTTNSYVVEEIIGEKIQRTSYCTGVTRPEHVAKGATNSEYPDLVLKNGKKLDVSAVAAVSDMGPGDVFMKGANALNHERGQAALLIGHPAGGTMGTTIGMITGRRIQLVIPVGLEKSVPIDLHEAARRMNAVDDEARSVPCLWPINGHIFTEIEAVKVLTGAEALPVGAGGIAGAEGSVRLLIIGSREQLDSFAKLRASIAGEPPFLA